MCVSWGVVQSSYYIRQTTDNYISPCGSPGNWCSPTASTSQYCHCDSKAWAKSSDCHSPWCKSWLQDNSHGKNTFAIGSCRPKKINGLIQEMEEFYFCETMVLNMFIFVYMTETWRSNRETLEKSLRLQILAPSFHTLFPHPQELYNRRSGRRFTASYSSPTSHQSKESIPTPSKHKRNQRKTKYNSLQIPLQSQSLQKVPSPLT